jgi:hypothetical protein
LTSKGRVLDHVRAIVTRVRSVISANANLLRIIIDDKKIDLYVPTPKIMTSTERPIEGSKEKDKKKSDPIHYLTFEITPFGISPRAKNSENMANSKTKAIIDCRDEKLKPEDYGIKAHLACFDPNQGLRFVRNASGKPISWFNMTADARKISNERVEKPTNELLSAMFDWEVITQDKSLEAEKYPLPFLNRPPPQDSNSTDHYKKIQIGLVLTGSNVGYGSGSMKTHYRIPNNEAIYVLPIPIESNSAKSCLPNYTPAVAGSSTSTEVSGAISGTDFMNGME